MIVAGDARRIPLPDESVQCVVTSPPYWGLRKYKGEQELIWGPQCPRQGEPGGSVLLCESSEHEWRDESVDVDEAVGNWQQAENRTGLRTGVPQTRFRGDVKAAGVKVRTKIPRGTCRRCGCWRGAYGLEPTVEMYVAHTIEILREIRRVLRKDGVVFWNIGDSYSSQGGQHSGRRDNQTGVGQKRAWREGNGRADGATDLRGIRNRDGVNDPTLKPKDLCLIPERVALAAQADGWWVRSRIIWARPNPMPESVTDRPTDATDHIWLFAKSERYFWDAEAVREPHRNLLNVWTFPTQPYSGAHFATFPEELPRKAILAGTSARGACSACGAPWERLISREDPPNELRTKHNGPDDGMVMGFGSTGERYGSGQKMQGWLDTHPWQTLGWRPTCSCGGFILRERACFSHRHSGRRSRGLAPASWKGSKFDAGKTAEHQSGRMQVRDDGSETSGRPERRGAPPRLERAWYRRRWQERIDAYWPRTVPCLVLDPFGGSGTTGRVAVELNRRAVLLDLAYAGEQAEYARLARERTSNVQREMFA